MKEIGRLVKNRLGTGIIGEMRKIYNVLIFAKPKNAEEIIDYLFQEKSTQIFNNLANNGDKYWKHKIIRK